MTGLANYCISLRMVSMEHSYWGMLCKSVKELAEGLKLDRDTRATSDTYWTGSRPVSDFQ